MKKRIKLLALVMAVGMLWGCNAAEDETQPPKVTRVQETAPAEETLPPETEFVSIPADPVSVSEADLSDISITVTRVGTYPLPEGVSFGTNMPVIRTVEEEITTYTLLSASLEDLAGVRCHRYTYFGDGLTAAYVFSQGVPRCSLVNVNTGEVYVDDGACRIQQLTDRFYYVIYATGRTGDKSQAIVRFTDRMFTVAPEEEVVYYKGYARIFDLEKGGFIPDLVLEEPGNVAVCAETTISVEIDWYTSDIYTVDGRCIARGVEAVTVCGDVMIQKTGDGVLVYDSGFNLLRVLEQGDVIDEDAAVYPSYSGKFLKVRDEETELLGAVDMGGNPMLDPGYSTISGSMGDYLFVGNEVEEQWLYGVTLADGTMVIPCEYEGVYADDELPVIHYYHDDGEFLYIPGVGSVNITGYSRGGLVYYTCPNAEDPGVRSYLIFGTGRFVTCAGGDVLCGLVIYSPEMGLVDAVSGRSLISGGEFVYDRVTDSGEYIYGIRYDTAEVTVYRVDRE